MFRTTAMTALGLALTATSAAAQDAYPATLAGHAVLPAATFAPAPADAPSYFQTSGRFTGPSCSQLSIGRAARVKSGSGSMGSGSISRSELVPDPFKRAETEPDPCAPFSSHAAALDHAQSCARLTNPARTGLRST